MTTKEYISSKILWKEVEKIIEKYDWNHIREEMKKHKELFSKTNAKLAELNCNPKDPYFLKSKLYCFMNFYLKKYKNSCFPLVY